MKTNILWSIFLIVTFFTTAISAATPTLKNNVIKSYKAIDANDAATLRMMLADDYSFTNPILPTPIDKNGFIAYVNGIHQSLSGMVHEIQTAVQEGKTVMVYGIFKAKYVQPMPNGPQAMGQTVELPFTNCIEFNDKGLAKSAKVTFDNYQFMVQLGAVNPKAPVLMQLLKESIVALNKRDWAKFGDFMSENTIDYAVAAEPVKGKSAVLQGIQGFFNAFPDATIEIEDMIVSGNKVYVKNTFKGTHTQSLFGMIPATDKKVFYTDVDIMEFDDKGKISAHWAQNPNECFRQIGYGAFVNPNTSVVMAIFEKFQRRDLPAFLALLDDNLEYDAKDHPILPNAKPYKGKAEFTNWVKEYNEKIQNVKLEPQRFFADGDDVMVTLNVEYLLKSTGKSYAVPLVQHWRFRDGKAVWLKAIGGEVMESVIAMKK
jgi:ketosteroid isomerase-like protein